MQYTWQLALVLVSVYCIKHSVSCYIYYMYEQRSYNIYTDKGVIIIQAKELL